MAHNGGKIALNSYQVILLKRKKALNEKFFQFNRSGMVDRSEEEIEA